MELQFITDLDSNLSIFAAVLTQWVPVAVGLACFVGLASMFAFSFVRGR
jgi:hypothetical protein